MREQQKLQRHLSPLGAWAFSIGTSVGWGSLVVTANTYLAQAGPAGSVLGLVVGTLVMLLMAWNYSYLIRAYPDSGGAYTYTREIIGYDRAFLAAWFLAMTYFAILWANATSLPLFGRIFLGSVFRYGKLYTVFGYEVFAGEALLSVAALLVVGILCMRVKRLANAVMIILALVFTAGIAVCFVGAAAGGGRFGGPAFVPDSAAITQIVKIAVISPWAFIGFESISHGAEEFTFQTGKIRRVLLISVLSAMLLYGMVTLLSVTAYPPQYDSWLSYIRDLDSLSGIEALPAFYAASRYLGGTGVALLMLSLLALVISSLFGNISALSRLIYALSRDRILPARFGRLNRQDIPGAAICLVVGVSVFVPLIGRTAIGWIVDVTTIGATLIYGFVSAAAAKHAGSLGDRLEKWTGRIGFVLMIAFGVYILLPNLVTHGSLAKETYFLFIVWSVLGFLFFRGILHRDKERRFGQSIVVWVVLLALVLLIALIWMRQSMIESNEAMRANITEYYEQLENGRRMEDAHYVEEQIAKEQAEDTRTILMAVGMFAFALVIMLNNNSYMSKRSKESERLANTDPLTGVKSKHAFQLKENDLNASIADEREDDFAIVVCDVNGLKKINDTLGHKAGDEYIREACKMVCDIFQHSPVFRVGGDEFVVILQGRDYSIRRELMIAMHESSVDHISSGGAVVSAGCSEYRPGEDAGAHVVFERADALMYEEKQRLKGLGAVTRDEPEPENTLAVMLEAEPSILHVPRHVLIVEDEEINRLILKSALEEDYDILSAADGVQALKEIKEHKNDLALVLLDLRMPRMDGMEVLKTVKEDPELKHIPVIILTADQEAEVACLHAGAMDFIPKPYPNLEIIRARVSKCVELTETRDIIQSTERDSLTRLYNIDYFFRFVHMYDQHYADMLMDAVVIDVNQFRLINERYGRQYGDSVLRNIGERIRSLSREIGAVGCRRGVDTFLIYCPHREDYDSLLERLAVHFEGEDSDESRVRLRLGVYENADKEVDVERRFDYAKIAADSVRGNYLQSVGHYSSEMHDEELYQLRLLEDFHQSVEQGCFRVCFQPKFDVRPDVPTLASAEALVRWEHPELGMISPGVFIPLLEENGLVMPLDSFVWRETARNIRAWKDRFGFSVPVSVNVSRIDMLMPNLKETFTELLEEYGLSPSDLMLEITESAYTGDSEQVIAAAQELRSMGFRMEMDDFGTGYSSLGMLSHLPVDALKLDMSFIRSAFGQTRDTRMIELILDIADYLGVPVVAEGVETEEQCLVLKAMGCDLVQGYYFSRPVPPEEFERFLIERKENKTLLTPEVKNAFVSISRALSGEFESLWYIDMVTDGYLEFRFGPGGALSIRSEGSDFFSDVRGRLLEGLDEADAAMLSETLEKRNLLLCAQSGEALSRFFVRNGEEICLQTIKTRNSDGHHVVIGFRPAQAGSDEGRA